jgi:hypothetical protein
MLPDHETILDSPAEAAGEALAESVECKRGSQGFNEGGSARPKISIGTIP